MCEYAAGVCVNLRTYPIRVRVHEGDILCIVPHHDRIASTQQASFTGPLNVRHTGPLKVACNTYISPKFQYSLEVKKYLRNARSLHVCQACIFSR